MTPWRDLELRRAAQGHVLADRGDRRRCWRPGRCPRARDSACPRSASTRPSSRGRLGDFAHERLEFLVAGDEVGLGVHLDDDAARCRATATATRPSAATRPAFLAALDEALLAQPVDGGLDIAAVSLRARPCSPSCPRRSSRAGPSPCGGDVGHGANPDPFVVDAVMHR